MIRWTCGLLQFFLQPIVPAINNAFYNRPIWARSTRPGLLLQQIRLQRNQTIRHANILKKIIMNSYLNKCSGWGWGPQIASYLEATILSAITATIFDFAFVYSTTDAHNLFAIITTVGLLNWPCEDAANCRWHLCYYFIFGSLGLLRLVITNGSRENRLN